MKQSRNFDWIQKNTAEMVDLWMYNFVRNSNDFLYGKSLKKLSIFKNKNVNPKKSKKSAIVIGAGPSIRNNNHLELLGKSNFNGAIVCTDRMLIPCLKNGITPKKFPKFYVLTIEPKDVTLAFYNDPIVKKFHKGIRAILSTCTEHETVEVIKKNKLEIFWFHPLIDDYRKQGSINKIMNLMSKSKSNPTGFPGLQTGGNVGCFSWIFSWAILGCSSIALTGIDLGHDENTPLSKTRHYGEYLKIFKNDKNELKKYFKTIKNPDLNVKVLSDPIFDFYREAFLDLIIRSPKWVTTVNCTEGGSMFGKRLQNSQLSNFIK